MHSVFLNILLNYSIVAPALAILVVRGRITRQYLPFVAIIWIGLINESVSAGKLLKGNANTVNSNVYVLLEYLLLLMQFWQWSLFGFKKMVALAAAGTFIWIAENFIISDIGENNSLFRVGYSVCIVLLSISKLHKLLLPGEKELQKNAVFIICITFLFYYCCKAYVETFNVINYGVSKQFLWNLYIILYFINFSANVLFTYGILCIKPKQDFIMQL